MCLLPWGLPAPGTSCPYAAGMIERPPAGTVPDVPGSYQFKDIDGRVLYVGKAKSLRHRLNSYFGRRDGMAVRTAQMLEAAESVEWIQVSNELEALMLEFSLIQEHSPRFNIDLKDDKSYPFLAVTLDHEWPRAMVMRGRHRRGRGRHRGVLGDGRGQLTLRVRRVNAGLSSEEASGALRDELEAARPQLHELAELKEVCSNTRDSRQHLK